MSKPNIHELADILSDLQTEELAQVIEEMNIRDLNKRLQPIIDLFRDLELTKKETEVLCRKLTNINESMIFNRRNNFDLGGNND